MRLPILAACFLGGCCFPVAPADPDFRPGEPVDPAAPPDVERWWPDLEWESAEAAPIVSSGAGGE